MMRGRYNKSKKVPSVDPQVLGKLLILQATLHTFPDSENLAEFLSRGLEEVPGTGFVMVQIFPFVKYPREKEILVNEICKLCGLGRTGETTNMFLLSPDRYQDHFCIHIKTMSATYGCFFFAKRDGETFKPYQPFLENLANTVALTLEIRNHESNLKRVNGELQHTKEGLEILVQERTKELTLKNQELQRWAHIFEHAEWGVAVSSADGKTFELMNPAFARMHGYTIDELKGQPLHIVSSPEIWRGVPINIDLDHEKGHHVWESIHIRKDGSRFPVQFDATTVRDELGKILYRVINVQDITARKQAEEELHESEERLRAVVQTANDAIITVNARGDIAAWNAAAETIFGFSADEILGRPVTQIMPEQFRTAHLHGSERALTSDERLVTGKTVEVAGLAKDGREFPMEMSFAEWRTQTGDFFTAIIRDTSERKQRENELQAIATLSAALRTAPTRAEMFPVIIGQLVVLLNCETISVEIIDPLTGDAVTEVAQGAWKPLMGTRQKSGTGINAIISRTRQPYYTNDLNNDPNFAHPELVSTGIHSGVGAPLIAQDQLIGFVWMGRKTDISKSEIRLLVAVADIAANAIHRATLHEQTRKDAANLAQAYDTTLEGWAHALELRDQETEGHTRRMVQMTVDLARAMGIGEEELEHVRRGVLLHDIGKMGIPDAILLKPGELTDEEWITMRKHPTYAHNMLSHIEYLKPALDIPHFHHEKWDGSGYPHGLKSEEIPLSARIFAIVDVWDAVQSDRPYKTGWPREKAIEYIRVQSGKHFDPYIVDVFLRLVDKGEI
ncbi:MAG TPA: PAS domain S-box protein [Anaerolineales bacterium]|nr:PAS domain S-box protein [Anaerolineales bacterium]